MINVLMLTLPYPPSANRYYRHARGRTYKSDEARRYQEAAAWCAKLAGATLHEGAVGLELRVVAPDHWRKYIDSSILTGDLDMTTNTSTIEDYRRDIERKLGEFERRKGVELHSKEGKPIYAPDEHAKRLAALLTPVQDAVAEGVELAQKAMSEAAVMATAEHRSLLTAMSTEEIQRAAALAPFASEDSATMPLEQFAQQLQAVLHHGDTVSKELYRRYAQRRTDATHKGMHENRLQLLPAELEALGEIRQAVKAIGASLEETTAGKERAKTVQQAAELRTKAAGLLKFANDTLFKARGGPERGRLESERFARQYF